MMVVVVVVVRKVVQKHFLEVFVRYYGIVWYRIVFVTGFYVGFYA